MVTFLDKSKIKLDIYKSWSRSRGVKAVASVMFKKSNTDEEEGEWK